MTVAWSRRGSTGVNCYARPFAADGPNDVSTLVSALQRRLAEHGTLCFQRRCRAGECMRFTHQVAVVAGASEGIGKATLAAPDSREPVGPACVSFAAT